MNKAPGMALHVRVQGRVQGVGFRYFTLAVANQLGLTGWVRNLPEGDVECEAEGAKPQLEEFLDALRKGPSASRVDELILDWHPASGRFSEFSIR